MMSLVSGVVTPGRAPRHPAHLGAQYTSDRIDLHAQVFNLSTSGVYVATDTPDQPGTEACLSLRTHLARDSIQLRCRVARTGDRPLPGMGLAFVNPSSDNPEAVEAHRTIERYCRLFSALPRVLMVDDEPAILRLMGRYFEQEQLSFIGIDEPIPSDQTLLRFKPAVVILDIMMPLVSGIEVARSLSVNPETRDIPIIFHSAAIPNIIPEDLSHLLFIQKGRSRKVLLAEVKKRLAPLAAARAADKSSAEQPRRRT